MTGDDHSPKSHYRRGVGLMMLNRRNLVFIARRIDMGDEEAWQMPQGGIDRDETPETAALRELEEETGTREASIIAKSRDWLYYDLPNELQKKLWGGRYKGQKQKWFLLRFNGQDDHINIATEHPEFSAWRWEKPEKLLDLIVPFKRQLYQQILNEFSNYLR